MFSWDDLCIIIPRLSLWIWRIAWKTLISCPLQSVFEVVLCQSVSPEPIAFQFFFLSSLSILGFIPHCPPFHFIPCHPLRLNTSYYLDGATIEMKPFKDKSHNGRDTNRRRKKWMRLVERHWPVNWLWDHFGTEYKRVNRYSMYCSSQDCHNLHGNRIVCHSNICFLPYNLFYFKDPRLNLYGK